MGCISWVAGGYERSALMGCRCTFSYCISWVPGRHEHVAFHGLQVGINVLHFMACRWT